MPQRILLFKIDAGIITYEFFTLYLNCKFHYLIFLLISAHTDTLIIVFYRVDLTQCAVDALANTTTEAAKLISILLFHSGKLRAFVSHNEAEVIVVRNDELHVEFLAWFCLREGKYKIKLQSKYCRRVSSHLL